MHTPFRTGSGGTITIVVRVRPNRRTRARSYIVVVPTDTKLRDIAIPEIDAYVQTLSPYQLTPEEQTLERALDWDLTFQELGIKSGTELLVHERKDTPKHAGQWEAYNSEADTASATSRGAVGSYVDSAQEAMAQVLGTTGSPIATPISHMAGHNQVLSRISKSIRMNPAGSTADLLRIQEESDSAIAPKVSRILNITPHSKLSGIHTQLQDTLFDQVRSATRFGKYFLNNGRRLISDIHFVGDNNAISTAINKKEVKVVESVQLRCTNIDPCILLQQPQNTPVLLSSSSSTLLSQPSLAILNSNTVNNTNTNATNAASLLPSEAITTTTSSSSSSATTTATTVKTPISPQTQEKKVLQLLRFTVIKDFVGSFCLLVSKDKKGNDDKPESQVIAVFPLLYKCVMNTEKKKQYLVIDNMVLHTVGNEDALVELHNALEYAYSSMYSSTIKYSFTSDITGTYALRNMRMRFATVELAKSLCNFNFQDSCVIDRETMSNIYKVSVPPEVPSLKTLLYELRNPKTSTQSMIVLHYTYLLEPNKRKEVVEALCQELIRLVNSGDKGTPLDKDDVEPVLKLISAFITCPAPTKLDEMIVTLCSTFYNVKKLFEGSQSYYKGTDKEGEYYDLLLRMDETNKALMLFLKEMPFWDTSSPGRLHMETVPLDNGFVVYSGANAANKGFSGVHCAVMIMDRERTRVLTDKSTSFLPSVSTECTVTEQCTLLTKQMTEWIRTGLEFELGLFNATGKYGSVDEHTMDIERRVRKRILDAMRIASSLVVGVDNLEIFPDIIRLISLTGKPVSFIIATATVDDFNSILKENKKLEAMAIDSFQNGLAERFSMPNVAVFSLKPDTHSITFPMYIKMCYSSPFSCIRTLNDNHESESRTEDKGKGKGKTKLLLFKIDDEQILLHDGSIPNCDLLDHRITREEFQSIVDKFIPDEENKKRDSNKNSEYNTETEDLDHEMSEDTNGSDIYHIIVTKLNELMNTLGLDMIVPDFNLFCLAPIILDETGNNFGVCMVLTTELTEVNIRNDNHRFHFVNCSQYMHYLAQKNFPIRYSQFIMNKPIDSITSSQIENVLFWGKDIEGYISSDTLNSLHLRIAPKIKEAAYVREFMMNQLMYVFLSRTISVLGKLLSEGAINALKTYFNVPGNSINLDDFLSLEIGEKYDSTTWDKACNTFKNNKVQDPLSDGYDSISPFAGSAAVIRENLEVNFTEVPIDETKINERCFNYLDYKVDLTDAYMSMRVRKRSSSGEGFGKENNYKQYKNSSNAQNSLHSGSGKGFYRTHSRYSSTVGIIKDQQGLNVAPKTFASALSSIVREERKLPSTSFSDNGEINDGVSMNNGNINLNYGTSIQEYNNNSLNNFSNKNIDDMIVNESEDNVNQNNLSNTSAYEDNIYNIDENLKPYQGDIEILIHRENEITDFMEKCQNFLTEMLEVENKQLRAKNEVDNMKMKMEQDTKSKTDFSTRTTLRTKSGTMGIIGTTSRHVPGILGFMGNNTLMNGTNYTISTRGYNSMQVKPKAWKTSTHDLYNGNKTKKTPSGQLLFQNNQPIVRLMKTKNDNNNIKRELTQVSRNGTQRKIANKMSTILNGVSHESSINDSKMKFKEEKIIKFVKFVYEKESFRVPFSLIHIRRMIIDDLSVNFEDEGINQDFNNGILTLQCPKEISMELISCISYGSEIGDYDVFQNNEILSNTVNLLVLLGFETFKNLFFIMHNGYQAEQLSMPNIVNILGIIVDCIQHNDIYFLPMIRPLITSLPEDYMIRNMIFFVVLRFAISAYGSDDYFTCCGFSDIDHMFSYFKNNMNLARIYSERVLRIYFYRLADCEANKIAPDPELMKIISLIGIYVEYLDLSMFNFSITRLDSMIKFFPYVERINMLGTNVSYPQLVHALQHCKYLKEIRVDSISIDSSHLLMSKLSIKVLNV